MKAPVEGDPEVSDSNVARDEAELTLAELVGRITDENRHEENGLGTARWQGSVVARVTA